MKMIDLTGKRFGALTALSPVPAAETQDHCPGWRVRCDCGREKVVNGHNLRSGKITSCGCGIVRGKRISESLRNRKSYDDLTEQTFYELTALQYIHKDYWLWQCSCGKTTYARPSLVKTGRIRSCGHVLKATAAQKMQDNVIGYYDGTMVSRLRNLMNDPRTHGIRQKRTRLKGR